MYIMYAAVGNHGGISNFGLSLRWLRRQCRMQKAECRMKVSHAAKGDRKSCPYADTVNFSLSFCYSAAGAIPFTTGEAFAAAPPRER